MLKQILTALTIGAIGVGTGFVGGAVYKDKTIDVTQKDEYKQVVDDNNDLSTKLDTTKLALKNLTTQRDNLEATKKQLEAQLTTAQKQLSDKTAELETKQAGLESADEQIRALNTQISTLKTDAEANAEQITELQGQITTLTDTKTSLEKDIEDLNRQIKALNADIEDNASEIENLTTDISALKNRIFKLAYTAKLDVSELNCEIKNYVTLEQSILVTSIEYNSYNIYSYNLGTGEWAKILENAAISAETDVPKGYRHYVTIEKNGIRNLYSFKDFQLKQLTYTSASSGYAQYRTMYNGRLIITMPSSNTETVLYSVDPDSDTATSITSYKTRSVNPNVLSANNYLVVAYQGTTYKHTGLKLVDLDTNSETNLLSPESDIAFSNDIMDNKILLTRSNGIYEFNIQTQEINEILLYANSDEQFCTKMASTSNKAAHIYSVSPNNYYIWCEGGRVLFDAATKKITYLGNNYCYLGTMSGKAYFTYTDNDKAHIAFYDEQENVTTSNGMSNNGGSIIYDFPYMDDTNRMLLYNNKVFAILKNNNGDDCALMVYDSTTNTNTYLSANWAIDNAAGWYINKKRIVNSIKLVDDIVVIQKATGDEFMYDESTNSLKQVIINI